MIFKFLLLAVFVNAIAARLRLPPGECLGSKERLESDNRCFQLWMQSDGNLVLYRKSNNEPLWNSGTSGSRTERACMQYDGNFVTSDNNRNPTWNSGTSNNEKAFITMQDDGNVVIYARDSNRPIWSTNTVTGC